MEGEHLDLRDGEHLYQGEAENLERARKEGKRLSGSKFVCAADQSVNKCL